jgi:flagellar biogenesis protein FliO
MGRSPLASRHNLQLIRLGRKLLLVSVTPDRAETLAEVTDPEEVDHLSALCRQSQPGSISTTFRQVLNQLGSQPTENATASENTSRRAASRMN